MNIIRSQQGFRGTLYDVEYDNHTSFYFDRQKGTCKSITFPVVSVTVVPAQSLKYMTHCSVNGHVRHCVWISH